MAAVTAPSQPRFVRRLRPAGDEELVARVRAGDERAFADIYERHHRGLLSFCRHMLGSREEGEDALQHVFLSAHRDLLRSSKPITLKPWLYAIARNRCLSVLRARREQQSLEDVPEPATEGLAAAVQRRQDLRDLLGDLARLPDDQRAALVLSEIGALTHEEVAAALDVRRDKVKALVFQARESLAGSRRARETDCREIREQLSVLRGGALRRTTIKRHLEACAACRDFRAEVQRQRAAAAIVLPVLPTAGLRESVLTAAASAAGVGGGGAGTAGLAGGAAAVTGGKAIATKLAVVGVLAAGGTGGGLIVVDEWSSATPDRPVAELRAEPGNGYVRVGEPGSGSGAIDAVRRRAVAVARQRAAGAAPSTGAVAGVAESGQPVRRAAAPAGDRPQGAPRPERRPRGEAGAPTPGAPAGPAPAPGAPPPSGASSPAPAPAPAPASGSDGAEGQEPDREGGRPDRPREDRPREDRPREDRPREDRPRPDRPREDRPPPRPGPPSAVPPPQAATPNPGPPAGAPAHGNDDDEDDDDGDEDERGDDGDDGEDEED